MVTRTWKLLLAACLLPASLAQTGPTTTGVRPPLTTGTFTNKTTTRTPTSTYDPQSSTPPDVLLNVPELSVGRIELDVENLYANINLNAKVASLVQINAGVQLSVTKINVTIADVEAKLELIVRLGHLVDIVNRVFESVDLNPLIVGLGNATEALVGGIVGAVDGLLGSITKDGKTLNFLIDNLGNIVQQVVGGTGQAVTSIVGDYLTNMTFTGATQQLGNGLTKKTYNYTPLNALVDVITNTAGQVVQAAVQKTKSSTGSSTSKPTSSVSLPASSSQAPNTAVTSSAAASQSPLSAASSSPTQASTTSPSATTSDASVTATTSAAAVDATTT